MTSISTLRRLQVIILLSAITTGAILSMVLLGDQRFQAQIMETESGSSSSEIIDVLTADHEAPTNEEEVLIALPKAPSLFELDFLQAGDGATALLEYLQSMQTDANASSEASEASSSSEASQSSASLKPAADVVLCCHLGDSCNAINDSYTQDMCADSLGLVEDCELYCGTPTPVIPAETASSSSSSSVVIQSVAVPEICDNGKDDDRDGVADAADIDCQVEEIPDEEYPVQTGGSSSSEQAVTSTPVFDPFQYEELPAEQMTDQISSEESFSSQMQEQPVDTGVAPADAHSDWLSRFWQLLQAPFGG